MTTETQVAKEEVRATENTRSGQFYRPNVDIMETAEELVLYADLPGAKSEDIDINFEDGSLVIHGKVHNRQSAETSYLLEEFGVGDFYRTFKVSEHIDATRITAEFHDGVLVLHLPKVEAVKPRKITVQAR